MGVALAGLAGTVYVHAASIVGVILGGCLADKLVPFLFLTGWVSSLRMLVVAMVGFGFCKGVYDSNIFAAFYDVVPQPA